MNRIPVVAITVLLATAGSPRAEDRVVVADFSSTVMAGAAPAGWELSEKSGKADISMVSDGGVPAVRFRSANTSFSIQKKIKVDLKQFPLLGWEWKVTELPRGGDFRKSRTDDQAAQLFVAFSKTKAIDYIWDSSVPEGVTASSSPVPFMTIKIVVVRSGPENAGRWMCESRNVREDYRTLFGSEPPPVNAVRLQINTQHTKTSAESYFADVAFAKGSEQAAAPDAVRSNAGLAPSSSTGILP